jgi:hypothetical protein
MIKKKNYDGVVTAAHFSNEGKIDWVRAFERNGFVFSDRIIMDRETLVKNLQDGKRFKIGVRLKYQGNDFDIKDDIRLVEQDGDKFIVTGDTSANQDYLENIPII